MAIYHLKHLTIGKTTHAAGTAGAHLGYITRASACRAVISEHIPNAAAGSRGGAARKWMDEAEAADRKNARVVDKFTLALPLELNEAQRVEAVRAFIRELAGGKSVPFFAALHDKAGTKDATNPHAHVVIRDRDPATGKGRVIGTSEKGSTERAREIWEQVCNEALRDAGAHARVDRRSLADQGITDRRPSKHQGPQARAIEARTGASEKISRIRAAQRAPKPSQSPLEALKRIQDRKQQTTWISPEESLRKYHFRDAAMLVQLLDEKARHIWRSVTQKIEATKLLRKEAQQYLETRALPEIVSNQIEDISIALFRKPPKQPMPLRDPNLTAAGSGQRTPEPTPTRPATGAGFGR